MNWGRWFATAVVAAVLMSATSQAANHVRVDTISNVAPGTTDLRIGVYFTNDIPIVACELPLEFRTCGGGYIAGPSFRQEMNPAGRMYNSPLGPVPDPDGRWPGALIIRNIYATPTPIYSVTSCRRSVDPTQVWSDLTPAPDYTSPDAILMASVSMGNPDFGEEIALPPGTDLPGIPSYEFIVNTGAALGRFVIDTTCVMPANVLIYVDLDLWGVFPTFQLGMVGVGVPVGQCEPAVCDCPCHGDGADCGGPPLGILDVVLTIDVAFRAVPAVQSPNCPYSNTDLNCSGLTDVVDVVKAVNVELRDADPLTEYCVPCAAD